MTIDAYDEMNSKDTDILSTPRSPWFLVKIPYVALYQLWDKTSWGFLFGKSCWEAVIRRHSCARKRRGDLKKLVNV